MLDKYIYVWKKKLNTNIEHNGCMDKVLIHAAILFYIGILIFFTVCWKSVYAMPSCLITQSGWRLTRWPGWAREFLCLLKK